MAQIQAVLDWSRSDQGGRLLWVVDSDFGGPERLVITLILNDRLMGNMFFMKHVAAEKEQDADLFRYRTVQNIVADTIGLKHQPGLAVNTVIRLALVERELMAFHFASALVQAERAGKFTAINVNTDVEVIFPVAECVVTVDSGGAIHRHKSMIVGAQLQAKSGNQRQFEVNHCKGPGAL